MGTEIQRKEDRDLEIEIQGNKDPETGGQRSRDRRTEIQRWGTETRERETKTRKRERKRPETGA